MKGPRPWPLTLVDFLENVGDVFEIYRNKQTYTQADQREQTNKQTHKYARKQANKQPNKQTNITNQQTNTYTRTDKQTNTYSKYK